tara:strand:- start:142 stop:309 length:168 start_codon:yes stop_codon:yes gene_type:complete
MSTSQYYKKVSLVETNQMFEYLGKKRLEIGKGLKKLLMKFKRRIKVFVKTKVVIY